MPSSPGRTAQVMADIRRRAASRQLGPGDRLPSIRGLARSLGASPSTVAEAYDRLAAEGLIRARPGSGFFLAATALPLSLAAVAPQPEREIDPLWMSRQALDGGDAVLKPGCGWLPADWMPDAAIRRALRTLSRADLSILTDYGSPLGAPPLRKVLARQMSMAGLPVAADQLLLTGSGTHAIDLICRFMLRPGDTVLVDDPCYFNFRALLLAHQARVVGVPFTPEGPDPDAFAHAAARHEPRLYITNSAIHNPTGATLSARIAHRVLNAAAVADTVIVEDDIFADLEPEPSARLAVLDGLTRVIRIGSFSKTLSASVRCGFIAARPDWIAALTDLQVATQFGGPSPMAAAMVAEMLIDGSYRRHLDMLHRRLNRKRREAAASLAELGIQPWLTPRAGLFLWCRLPDNRNATVLAERAFRENVVLAPGDVFSAGRTARNFMRFNVAQMGDARLMPMLRRLLGEVPPYGPPQQPGRDAAGMTATGASS
ncbi:PLP-dependent aminotransferase family protein [Rhizosaccharibacter radicis]|uniref:PLP-dependent aminotransferase family protein n=1 Tax=Rhizosaccharibacter radicis TaxID=2782605 RepID=A0ABT1VXN9_9PROT|nr:PLP-dependent aminotransferase family protein [Acetobacteraceae bacterium KSS12]